MTHIKLPKKVLVSNVENSFESFRVAPVKAEDKRELKNICAGSICTILIESIQYNFLIC